MWTVCLECCDPKCHCNIDISSTALVSLGWSQNKCEVADAMLYFLLLVRYVPNVAKRSIIWDHCKKKYTGDRPATNDQRPTDDRRPISHLENFKWLREGSSDPLHVWFYGGVFGVGGSNSAISGFAKSKMAARPPSRKIQIAIYPRRIIRFTPCLVLVRGFRGRRIEWRYLLFD